MSKDLNRGPYVLKDGVAQDAKIFAGEMKPENEKKFDKYHQIKAVNQEVKKEMARRKTNIALESLLEGFGENI